MGKNLYETNPWGDCNYYPRLRDSIQVCMGMFSYQSIVSSATIPYFLGYYSELFCAYFSLKIHSHVIETLQACTKDGCNFVVKRHSRSIDVSRQCCGLCRGKLVDVEIPTSGSKSRTGGNTLKPTPRKRAPPSAYNMFVKDQSKIIREELMHAQTSQGVRDPKVSQAEVMKECARRWRDLKERQTKWFIEYA